MTYVVIMNIVYTKDSGQMNFNFNTDGFNERTNYIHNANDMNKLKQNGTTNFDNSFAKMKVEENKSDVETTKSEVIFTKEEARGNQDNFIIRNNNMRNANIKPSANNPVSNAMNRNMFKK